MSKRQPTELEKDLQIIYLIRGLCPEYTKTAQQEQNKQPNSKAEQGPEWHFPKGAVMTGAGEDVGKWQHAVWLGDVEDVTAVGNSWAPPQKVEDRFTTWISNSSLRIILRAEACIWMFTEALSKILKVETIHVSV